MMQQFHYEGYNVLMKAYTTDRSLRIATVWLRQTDRWSSLYAVYDNMNPGGMPFNEWLKDLGIGEVSGIDWSVVKPIN